MATSATLTALIDAVLADLPRLSRHTLESVSASLQEARYAPLRDAWTRRRGRFELEFETNLRPRLAQAKQGVNPFKPARFDISSLSLVDEHMALREVGVNHAAKVCQDANTNALFQLNNFFKALSGIEHGRDPNWLRPTLFAQAMSDALSGGDLNAQGHYALMQAASAGLAAGLVPLYERLAEVLRQANLTELVSSQVPTPRTSAPRTGPGALDSLNQRSPDAPAKGSGGDLFSRLYDHILADPSLLPPVKDQLARLRRAMEHLARQDATLLRNQEHPAWRLINAVAAYCAAFTDTRDTRLQEFLLYLEEQTLTVIDISQPTTAQFEGLRRQLDGFIARQARSTSLPSQAALEQLERESQRGVWKTMLHEQLDAQLLAATITPGVRIFLQSIWVEVIVQSMITHGQDSDAAAQAINFVDDLIDSLQPHRDAVSRERLRLAMPGLIAQLETGLNTIDLNPKKRAAILSELMKQHGRVLSGYSVTPPAPKAAPASSPREAEDGLDPDAQSTLHGLLLDRESAFASVWAHANVNRSALPTQPIPLADTESPAAEAEETMWMQELQLGGWLHISIQGHWMTAQLAWVRDDGQLLLLVGQDENERHTITRRALAQLYRNGLAMNLEQEALVERAINTLMQDLP